MPRIKPARAAALLGLSPASLRTPDWDAILSPVFLRSGHRRYDESRVLRVASDRARVAATTDSLRADWRSK